MEPKPIIEVKNVGKRYNINRQKGGYVALRDVITHIIFSPFSFLKAKAKEITGANAKEEFWALKGLDFTVKKGEVIGIIGKNGTGKSTLLKILSQITPPTTGEIIIRGRVGSLLEVGTGFHPELSGRENIFLNGAILGMSKKEIAEKFDKIVEFSGIEKFIDTPVKYYSSGMYVRLAFSVAAHMEPDILIIDEVLAVGDIEFQKKCLGKMDEVTRKEGRTILFVSHNMDAVRQLCTSVILLDGGKIINSGPTEKVISEYLNQVLLTDKSEIELPLKENAPLSFIKISIMNEKKELINKINQEEDYFITLELESFKSVPNIDVGVTIRNSKNTDILFSLVSDINDGLPREYLPGKYRYTLKLKGGFLMPGTYSVKINIFIQGVMNIDMRDDILSFEVINNDRKNRSLNYGIGCVSLPCGWKLE